jgi:hypothetical protein
MNTSIYTLFCYSFIVLIVGYTVGILTYAYEHFRIEYNESIWEKATDEEVIAKICDIIKEFDKEISKKTLYEKEEILKKAHDLNKNNLQFRIRCFKDGVKNRMNKMLNI